MGVASERRFPVVLMVEPDDGVAGVLHRVGLLRVPSLAVREVVWGPVHIDGRLLFGVEEVRRGPAGGDVVLGVAWQSQAAAVEDGQPLTLQVGAGQPPQLRYLDFKTQRTSLISALSGSPTTKRRGLAVSPDESTLLYTSIDAEIGDIMLLEGVR